MPPQSVALATPPSDALLPRTTTAVVDHGSPPETQTGTRTSGSEPHSDRSPQWHSHGCGGTLWGNLSFLIDASNFFAIATSRGYFMEPRCFAFEICQL